MGWELVLGEYRFIPLFEKATDTLLYWPFLLSIVPATHLFVYTSSVSEFLKL